MNRAVSKEDLPKADRGSSTNQATAHPESPAATKKANKGRKGEFAANFKFAKSQLTRQDGETKKSFRQRVLAKVKANLQRPGVWSHTEKDDKKDPPNAPASSSRQQLPRQLREQEYRKGKGKSKRDQKGSKGKGKGKSRKGWKAYLQECQERNAREDKTGAGIDVPAEGVKKGILERAHNYRLSGGSEARKQSWLDKSRSAYQKRRDSETAHLRPPGMPPMMPYEDPPARVRLGERFAPKGKGKSEREEEYVPFWMRRKQHGAGKW